MSEAFDTSGMTDEEIQEAIAAGDIEEREGFDDEGNEIKQYELTEVGRYRVLSNMLVNVISTAVGAYHEGRSYRRVIDYLENVLDQLKPKAQVSSSVSDDVTTT